MKFPASRRIFITIMPSRMIHIKAFRKYETISEISRDIGLVFFATMFIEPIVAKTLDPVTIILGLLLSLISWFFSLSIARK